MSTPENLERQGRLERFRPDLLPGDVERRMLYILPRALGFLESTLPGLTSDGYIEGAKTPLDQADDLMTRFVISDEMSSMPPHSLSPSESGVWELRSADLRLIGWFWRPGIFLLSAVAFKQHLVEGRGTYSGYREQAVFDRNQLNLDPPPFISGSLEDVL